MRGQYTKISCAGTGRGMSVDPRRIELEGQGPGRGVRLPGVGSFGCVDQRDERPQDPVGVETRNLVDGLVELRPDDHGPILVVGLGIEPGGEEFPQVAGDRRVLDHDLVDVARAEPATELGQVAGVGPKDRHAAPVDRRRRDQPVEHVALGGASVDGEQGLAEASASVGVEAEREPNADVVDEVRPGVGDRQFVGAFVGDDGAEVVEQGDELRQRDGHRAAIELAAHVAVAGLERTGQPDVEVVLAEGLESFDVEHGGLGEDVAAVGVVEHVAVPGVEREPEVLAVRLDQRRAKVVVPVADDPVQAALEDLGVGQGSAVGRVGVDHQLEPGQGGIADLGGVPTAGPSVGLHQDLLDLETDVGVVAVSGHEDQAHQEAPVVVSAQEQADLSTIAQVEHLERHSFDVVDIALEELVARVGLQDVEEAAAVVAPGRELHPFEHTGHPASHHRDVEHPAGVDRRGEQADEPTLARHRDRSDRVP